MTIQEKIIDNIRHGLNLPDFSLSPEQMNYFTEINNRIPNNSAWGVAGDEGFFCLEWLQRCSPVI